MKLNFEKHQRDYTVLASSVLAKGFYGKEMVQYFSYTPHKLYLFNENGIFYHYLTEEDYQGWPKAWAKKYNLSDFRKYITKKEITLKDYRKFLSKKHPDLVSSLILLHEYINSFSPVVIATTYVPMHINDISKNLINYCLKVRKKFEDVHKVGMDLQVKLLNKLERDLGIKKDSLQYLTTNEFDGFIKYKKLPKNLLGRKKLFLIEHDRNKVIIIPKSKIKSVISKIDKIRNNNIKIKSIKGNVAYPGKITGKVRLIKLVKDINQLKKGEVLVASMTDPRYLPAIKRASAIVTDEGGITCHAAIVARELKKPCIIGTKIATQVLRDGDKIEVDASKGIVKKI